MLYWIKERHNPQLGIYYVPCGPMFKKDAKKHETGTLYGDNVMIPFNTEAEYNARLEELRKSGERVH